MGVLDDIWAATKGWGSDAWDYVKDFEFEDDWRSKDSESTGLIEDVLGFFMSEDPNNPGQMIYDPKKILAGGAGVAQLLDYGPFKDLNAPSQAPSGYQGGIPSFVASRQRVPGTYDSTRRPGSGGQRYFTDTVYTPKGQDAPTARQTEQAAALQAANLANLARETKPVLPEPTTSTTADTPHWLSNYVQTGTGVSSAPAIPDISIDRTVASGAAVPETGTPELRGGGKIRSGIASILPKARYSIGGGVSGMPSRYLGTAQDGMADTIPTTIDNKDPAALSGGEFVVAADVVSGLGNGNSDAGAKELYNMMDRVRQARTGTTQQGKQINPQRMMMV